MVDRWREFALAEASTLSRVEVERRYDRYLEALDAYMRAKRGHISAS